MKFNNQTKKKNNTQMQKHVLRDKTFLIVSITDQGLGKKSNYFMRMTPGS
jgi:hypothetical protein